MPLVDYSLRALKTVVDRQADEPGRKSALSLSHPDVIATRDTLEEVFGERVRDLPARADGQKTIEWHKASGMLTEVVDTTALFAAIGYALRCVDVTQGRGNEYVHDLSLPVPADAGLFDNDLVFDCISHQVFNVAQAWRTMADACRPGGYVLSVTPMNIVNNGFWSVSPTAYFDFFEGLGFDVEYRAIRGRYREHAELPYDRVRRMRDVPEDAVNLFIGRKPHTAPEAAAWPVMSKFRQYPTSHR